MLSAWVAPSSIPEFITSVLHRAPLAAAGTTHDVIPYFGWETLGGILGRDPDVLVVARGELLDVPPPRDLDELVPLFERGVGLVLRHAERCDDGLAALARRFTDELPGECQVQLFVTPPGTHGFGWHYDWEDVFIAQTEGVKDYFFRANTVEPDVPFGGRADFFRVKGETSPLMTARLVAGDFLYIPARWWHMAICREPSLSISIGAIPTL